MKIMMVKCADNFGRVFVFLGTIFSAFFEILRIFRTTIPGILELVGLTLISYFCFTTIMQVLVGTNFILSAEALRDTMDSYKLLK